MFSEPIDYDDVGDDDVGDLGPDTIIAPNLTVNETDSEGKITAAAANFWSSQKKSYLFFSHQNRTKMYVIGTFNEILNLDNQPKINTKYRFSNASILCLNILKDKGQDKYNLKLDLVYTGDSSSNKKPKIKKPWMYGTEIELPHNYWVKGEDYDSTTVRFTPHQFQSRTTACSSDVLLNTFKINPQCLKDNVLYYCFFIRHGQGVHNAIKYNTKLNTELTNLGVSQAEKAGTQFASIMDNCAITTIDAIAASDLTRTHQTAENFLTSLVKTKSDCLNTINCLYIIPCLHELENSMKDGSSGFNRSLSSVGLPVQNENKTTCTPETCSQIIVNGITIVLCWDYYKKFYGESIRGKGGNRSSCRNSHFLGLFFGLITSLNSTNAPIKGGVSLVLNKKYTKKHRKYNRTNKRRNRKNKSKKTNKKTNKNK